MASGRSVRTVFKLHSEDWRACGCPGISLPSAALPVQGEEDALPAAGPTTKGGGCHYNVAFSTLWEHSPDSLHQKPRVELRVWLCGALPATHHMVCSTYSLQFSFALLFVLPWPCLKTLG